MTDTAVVLLSGGIDSATCLGIACNQHDKIIPIHVQYGQQTAELEKKMAERQRAHMAAEYKDTDVMQMRVVNYEPVFGHFADGVADPEKSFDHMTEEDGRSAGYVPMRNLHLIATAAGFADDEGASAVYHGAQGGDEADYPDCRQGFMDKAAGAICKSLPDDQSLDLRIPLINFEKASVIEQADLVGVDFAYTYSCYEAEDDLTDPSPCGECPACEERIEAFEEARVIDPYMPEEA